MAHALYSTAAVTTALNLIGESRVADNAPGLYRQILKAVCGGDSDAVFSQIGADRFGETANPLLKQILVAYGTQT